MSNPGTDVAAKLATALSGTLTLNTNLFAEPPRDPGRNHPQNCVYVLQTGGPTPERYCINTASPQFRRPIVQIRVRSVPEGYSTGLTLARQVKDALHAQTLTGYIDCRVREAEPLYLNKDPNGSHNWSLNVELILEE